MKIDVDYIKGLAEQGIADLDMDAVLKRKYREDAEPPNPDA
jgi:hypothetical protein